MLIVDAAAGVLLTMTCLWSAYAVACRLTGGSSASVRLTAASVIAVWQLSVAFLLLSAARLFVRPVALTLWCVAAVLAHRFARSAVDPSEQLRADLASLRTWWLSLNTAFRVLIGVGGGLVLVRVVHGLLAPCLTWDALTYHLYKPAVWVQARGLVSTVGPDAAGYYAWFPPYGDAIWAWWLLVMRGDVAIAPIAAAMWAMIPLASYACARAFGVPSIRATGAALAIAFTPAVMNFAAAVYVDNLVVALFVAAVLFLIRAIDTRSTVDGVLAAAAFAILAGVKSSVLPISAVGIAATAALTKRRAAIFPVLVAALPAAIPSLLALVATGSPVYPLTVRIGNRVIFAGNAELQWLLRAGWMTPWGLADARARLFGRLFFPWERMNADFLNLGLGPLLLIPGTIPGFVRLWGSKSLRYVGVFLILSASVTIAAVAGEGNVALRLWWWGILGRLVTIAVACAALISAASRSRASTTLLWACAAAGVMAGWPRGLAAEDQHAARAVVPFLLLIVASFWGACIVAPRARLPLRWAAALAIVMAFILTRDRFRYDYYAAAAAWRAYDVHPIDSRWTASWPVWQRLDGASGATIAVSAGWDGIGHNWYRYPLLGRRFQNHLLYIPISSDGQFLDYGLTAKPRVACDAWLQRISSSNAEYFVLLPPLPLEERWARALPRVFVPELELARPGTVLYRIDRNAIRTAACGPAGVL